MQIFGAILAFLAVLVVIGDFYRVLEIGPEAGFFAATDVGIYVTLIGALLTLAGVLHRIPMNQEKQGRGGNLVHPFAFVREFWLHFPPIRN